MRSLIPIGFSLGLEEYVSEGQNVDVDENYAMDRNDNHVIDKDDTYGIDNHVSVMDKNGGRGMDKWPVIQDAGHDGSNFVGEDDSYFFLWMPHLLDTILEVC